MYEDDSLLPPRSVLFDRLTRNVREKKILEALLKLSVKEEEEQERRRTSERSQKVTAGRGA